MTNMTTHLGFRRPIPKKDSFVCYLYPYDSPKNDLKTISKSLEKGKPSPLRTFEDFWRLLKTFEDFWRLFAVVSHFFPITTLAGLLWGLRWRLWLRRLTLRTRQDGGLPHAAGATCRRMAGRNCRLLRFYGQKYENIPIWRTMMRLLFLFYYRFSWCF